MARLLSAAMTLPVSLTFLLLFPGCGDDSPNEVALGAAGASVGSDEAVAIGV